MNRRTYLAVAATGVVGSVAGCMGASDGSEYPPYPNSEATELSGDGPGISDSFEISQAGPTLVDIEHHGSEDFVVAIENPGVATDEPTGNESAVQDPSSNETTSQDTSGNETASQDIGSNETAAEASGDVGSTVTTVANALGPYDGRTLHSIAPNSYVLNVLQADDEWDATVYDLPEYDDGTGISLPIKRESQLYDVIGPVNFGEQEETEFNFEATGSGAHQVFLVDRNGTVQQNTANIIGGGGEETATLPVAGVGYVEIRTTGSWTLEIS